MKLHFPASPAGPYGWGCFGQNMTRELAKSAELCGPDEADVVFMPLATHDFEPASSARGKINLAMTFFEFPLGPNAAANAAKYDVVFAGSTWCLDRMRERGITNGALLIQGVDETIFSPQPPRKPDGQFRVFSGGKFEYRKGQDLVIAAFREFTKSVPEAHLVCSWFNPWPQLMANMMESKCIDARVCALPGISGFRQEVIFKVLLQENGLADSQFTILPQLSQQALAAEMANTDCGLFPNRCEGGTNLVLMEYASLGREIVANRATGHKDVDRAITAVIPFDLDENGWANQNLKSIVFGLTEVHREPMDFQHIVPPSWPWSEPARIVLKTATELLRDSTSACQPFARTRLADSMK